MSAMAHNPGGQQGPVSISLRANFALFNNLKDCGWLLDVDLKACHFEYVSSTLSHSASNDQVPGLILV